VVSIAVCFGVSLFVLAFMVGHISGAHINSVISISFVVLRKISPLRGTFVRCVCVCLLMRLVLDCRHNVRDRAVFRHDHGRGLPARLHA
jgi:glycerol uptake facilitator-like aquaporin